jgi:hypothetical protein
MTIEQIRWLALATMIVAAPALGPLRAQTAEQPVAREKSPPGDIPDSQVFVTYRSPLGFSIKAPEGWARTERDGVRFADKYGVIDITIVPSVEPLKISSVRADAVKALEQAGRAVRIGDIAKQKLPAGEAVLIKYTSNSDPNPVIGKQIRLEHDRYLIAKDGKLATIDFSAPEGADNVDQWRLMSNAFSW